MATVGAGQGQQPLPAQAVTASGVKGDNAPVLQQLNLGGLRTRTQDLHNAIGRILHAFHTNPSIKWSEVLSQFAMVNVELLNLVDDIKPIMKMFVVYPKNVNAENAPILPIMLSSKLLPEMETEEAALKEQLLGGMANLSGPVQTDKLQRQIEAVRSACDMAEKVITEARKVYGLGTRQGPVALSVIDKPHMSRITEYEKQLRAATNFGEGLRIPADQQQQPTIFPQHLASAFATAGDGRASYPGFEGGFAKAPPSVLPPTGPRSGPQQQAIPLTARVQTPTQPVGAGVGGIAGASPSQLPYMVNSPRSAGTNFNVPSPQQTQAQQTQQQVLIQRAKALQRQQLQAQLQQHNQQLRRPNTPPIPQAQPQAQVLQQQQQKQIQQLQQHQQQSQNRLTQQYAQQQQTQQLMQQHQIQDRQTLHQQQQNLQQQLQSSQIQTTQNSGQQGGQVRQQMGQLGSSMTNLYGAGTQNLLSSNMMGTMSQGMPSQSLLQQRLQQMHQNTNQPSTNQPQQNVSSMLSDSLYNMGVPGGGTQLPQNSASNLGLPLGLPLQQQLPQQNYMNIFNNSTQSNFGQNRSQPPSS